MRTGVLRSSGNGPLFSVRDWKLKARPETRTTRLRASRRRRAWLPFLGSFIVLLLLPPTASAYNMDSHYYLRYALSLTTCFDWEEAHVIASGDWGLDENGTTHAEMHPLQRQNKLQWHAFGHSDQRFNELWLRSTQEPDLEQRLIKLGQFMHFLEDWEAHAGYGTRMGHARDTYRGRDPDSLANSRAKNHRMVQSALDHLLKTCDDLGRPDTDPDRLLIRIMSTIFADGLLQDLYEQSDAGWKKGKLGGFRKDGQSIVAANKNRIEEFIEAHLTDSPTASVPADFEPGPEHGIPPSLRIPFTQDGIVLDKTTDLEAFRQEAAEQAVPDVTVSLESAEVIRVGPKAARWIGWQIALRIENVGSLESEGGQVQIVAIDSEDESVLAQTTEDLPVLQPGEVRNIEVRLPTTRPPESDVILGAFARVGDLTAMNDEDWLMMGDAEEEAPDEADVTDVDPQPEGPETVQFMAAPKTFIEGSTACLVVTAMVSGGDSTEKLDVGDVEVIGRTFERGSFRQVIPSRWSAVVSDDGPVGGKTIACFEPKEQLFDELRKTGPQELSLAVTLEADEVDPRTEIYPMDPEFYDGILSLQKESN